MRWFASYLSDRLVFLVLRHVDNENVVRTLESSLSPPINVGVSQGSNLVNLFCMRMTCLIS